jgi:hypothetical protein
VGTYVCGDGSYSPTCGCAYNPPIPVPTQIVFPPDAKANWSFSSNADKTFDVRVSLSSSSTSQYSAVLNKCKGCDPGPKTDFYSNEFLFYKIKPGKYYLNTKMEVGGYWSTNVYWDIEVPSWYAPSPSPYPTLIAITTRVITTATTSDNSTSNVLLGFVVFIFIGFIFSRFF